MNFTLFLAIIIAVFGKGKADNFTIYIESAHYRGHYLGALSTAAMANVTLLNPPLGTQHKWTVDWDRIFIAPGSPIICTQSQSSAMVAFIESAASAMNMPAKLLTTAGNFTMRYQIVNNQALYQFISNVATPPLCLYDTGTLPVVHAADCTGTRSFWKVYSA